ncbi:unnamed protein product, partial [Bubo scandiacus]
PTHVRKPKRGQEILPSIMGDCEAGSMESESQKHWEEQSLRKTESVRRKISVQNQVLFSNKNSRSKKTC